MQWAFRHHEKQMNAAARIRGGSAGVSYSTVVLVRLNRKKTLRTLLRHAKRGGLHDKVASGVSCADASGFHYLKITGRSFSVAEVRMMKSIRLRMRPE